MPTDPHSTLEFDSLVRKRTEHFSGRQWVFAAIDEWLSAAGGSRVFLLAGGPGTGKTAIAARLVQASRGEVNVSAHASLGSGALSFAYFCQATRPTTLLPLRFVQSMSATLASRFPAFRAGLEQQASQQILISAPVSVGGPVHEGAHVVGANIEQVTIEIRGTDARAMFDEAVRKPLWAHAAQPAAEPIVILVDSLDEALSSGADTTIASLLQLVDDLAPQVRFILTSRPVARVVELFGEPSLDLIADAPPGLDEVKLYAVARLSTMNEPGRSAVAAQVADKSRGNFLYAYHVLNELTARAVPPSSTDVIDLPDELEGVYRAFLGREVAAGTARWTDVLRPLLGAIVVSRGDGLTRSQLVGVTGLADDRTDDALQACRQYLVGGESASQPFRIYHQSFREFLTTDTAYNVYPSERHAAIARYLLQTHGGAWKKCEDSYALSHAPLHLAEAARGSTSKRDASIQSLIELTSNRHYQNRCAEVLRDIPLLRAHMARAVEAASWSDSDAMLAWIVRAGNGLSELTDRFLTGASVVAQARAGSADEAEKRLALFDGLDRDWQQAASLIIAWLAIDQQPAAAKALVDRVAPKPTALPPLPLLLDRVNAALAGRGDFEFEYQAAQGVDVGRELVRRMSGQAFNWELLASRGFNALAPLTHQAELIQARGYAAQADGPVLVNIARESGADGTALVDEYIDAHAGYNYVEYRNSSLWILMHAVLRHHHDQVWVRERLARILDAALRSGGGQFTHMAALVSSALLQRAVPGTAPVVEPFGIRAVAAARALEPWRGANDSWSLNRRALTALMEAEQLVCKRPSAASQVWQEIQALEAARKLEGFAGFQAPAELRLADALRACQLAGSAEIDARLDRALSSAHHVQDFRFCARVTSRVNALTRWHHVDLSGDALAETVARLAEAPYSLEFAADHRVGEPFAHRDHGNPEVLPVWEAQQANTIVRLADVFQRPAGEFLRMNAPASLSAIIPDGTRVAVPDPALGPLLAVHLAARVIADASLGLRRAPLIRSLVPVSLANPTAFDSVLAYLFIAADPEDEAVLSALVEHARPGTPAATSTSPAATSGVMPT